MSPVASKPAPVLGSKRPRNVDAKRAAAILYGDWGTSKAYVIGLAFAVAGYSSFWLIAAMGVLTALVGINYIIVCRCYPDGGGVYASVRHRSEIISIVGAFLLIADYIVTASISALSAYQYLGVPHPEKLAALTILAIGALNFFGPRHTGSLAVFISVPTFIVVVLICLFSVPHLPTAWHNLQPLHGGFWKSWSGFVGIVLALSGVEAVANSTGVMKLDDGTTDSRPSVSRTATRAILWIMFEVCICTVLLGLAMHALEGLTIVSGDVNAPGSPGVRDYMLRYMGEVFVSHAFNSAAGHAFGVVVSVVFGALLFSAVNTAIGALVSIQFLMSRDGEVPHSFEKLNRYGVPILPTIFATVIPVILVLIVRDMVGLADLYAVGVVGAIAVNIGSCCSDWKLKIKNWERLMMFLTFAVMLLIEISLFVDKPSARVFAVTILAIGLVLRGIAKEREQRKMELPETAGLEPLEETLPPIFLSSDRIPMLCAVRGVGRTLDFALREAKQTGTPLYLLFVRVQNVVTDLDTGRKWQDDEDAVKIVRYAEEHGGKDMFYFCYVVSELPADTITEMAATLGVEKLILGIPRESSLIHFLRGNIISEISNNLPDNIDLIIHS